MYDYKDMKPYKGYYIQKVWEVDNAGKRTGPYRYIVSDDEDCLGEEYRSIAEAHRFVDSLT